MNQILEDILSFIQSVVTYIYTLVNFLVTIVYNLLNSGSITQVSQETETFLTPDNDTFQIWALIYQKLTVFTLSYTPLILKNSPEILQKYNNFELLNTNLNLNRQWITEFTVNKEFEKSGQTLFSLNQNVQEIIDSLGSCNYKKLLYPLLAWSKFATFQNDLIVLSSKLPEQQSKVDVLLQKLQSEDSQFLLNNFSNFSGSKFNSIELIVYLWAFLGVYRTILNTSYIQIHPNPREQIKSLVEQLLNQLLLDLNIPFSGNQYQNLDLNQFGNLFIQLNQRSISYNC